MTCKNCERLKGAAEALSHIRKICTDPRIRPASDALSIEMITELCLVGLCNPTQARKDKREVKS